MDEIVIRYAGLFGMLCIIGAWIYSQAGTDISTRVGLMRDLAQYSRRRRGVIVLSIIGGVLIAIAALGMMYS